MAKRDNKYIFNLDHDTAKKFDKIYDHFLYFDECVPIDEVLEFIINDFYERYSENLVN